MVVFFSILIIQTNSIEALSNTKSHDLQDVFAVLVNSVTLTKPSVNFLQEQVDCFYKAANYLFGLTTVLGKYRCNIIWLDLYSMYLFLILRNQRGSLTDEVNIWTNITLYRFKDCINTIKSITKIMGFH